MGYIQTTIAEIDNLITSSGIKTVCDLGAQNNYTLPGAPYTSEWYKDNGVTDYMAIDLSGENDSKQWDLSAPVKTMKTFDLVVDAGTSEHVRDLYMAFWNVDKLCKLGGYMLHENPRTQNWPLHGFHFFDENFYRLLVEHTGYRLISLTNSVSGNNHQTGNNVLCLMQKIDNKEFIDRELFPKTHTK